MEVDSVLLDVQAVLQDDDYSPEWIVGRFNEALNLVATMCRIPSLQATTPLTAAVNTRSIAMPKNYLHDLFLVSTPTYPSGVTLYSNTKDYASVIGTGVDNTGPIQIVSLDALILSYWPTPSVAEVLTCSYYSKPAIIAEGGIFPAYIPEVLQRMIFQNYALKEAYTRIEDGTDGKSFNTEKYNTLAVAGIQSLANLFPNAPKMKPAVIRSSSFF